MPELGSMPPIVAAGILLLAALLILGFIVTGRVLERRGAGSCTESPASPKPESGSSEPKTPTVEWGPHLTEWRTVTLPEPPKAPTLKDDPVFMASIEAILKNEAPRFAKDLVSFQHFQKVFSPIEGLEVKVWKQTFTKVMRQLAIAVASCAGDPDEGARVLEKITPAMLELAAQTEGHTFCDAARAWLCVDGKEEIEWKKAA